MESNDDLETVNRWNSEYDNVSVQNNDDAMMNGSWNHFNSDDGKSWITIHLITIPS